MEMSKLKLNSKIIKGGSLLMASTVALAACSTSGSAQTQETPEGSINGLFSAVKNIDSENTTKHFEPDNENIVKDNFLVVSEEDGKGKKLPQALKEYNSDMSHKITEVNVDGDTAVVSLDITYSPAVEPFTNASMEILALAFSSMGDEIDEEELDKKSDEILVRHLSEHKKEKETVSGTITLVKKDNLWFVRELDDKALVGISLGMSNLLDSLSTLQDDLKSEIEMGSGSIEIIDFDDEEFVN